MIKQSKIIWVVFLLSSMNISMAQDIILKNDNSTILSKVIEVSSIEIKYKKWSNQEGPTYSISISEVASINYQNGDVEKFSGNANEPTQTIANIPQQIPAQYKGYMDHNVENLTINGRVLSDEEVRNLFDSQTYQRYLEIKSKAKIQNGVGIALSAIGVASMSASWLIYQFGIKGEENYDKQLGKTCLALMLTGIATLTPGLVLGLTAGSKLNPIAEEYNQKQGISCSLNISPSLMKCEIPKSQGNYGLGLTLNMNF